MTNITAKTIKTTCEKRLKNYCLKLNNFVYFKRNLRRTTKKLIATEKD